MGYRKNDIPAIIVALESAKRHLWDGRSYQDYGRKEEFVCHALSAAGYGYGPAEELINTVLSKSGATTFCDWVQKNINPDASNRLIQSLRLKWIDKMIADLKEYAK